MNAQDVPDAPDAQHAGATRWRLAVRALELALADPIGLGGVAFAGRAAPARDVLLDALQQAVQVRRLGPTTDLAALDAGVDLVASLAAGRTVTRPGLLDVEPPAASGGSRRATLVTGAERLPRALGARLARWLDDAGRAPELLVLVDERDAVVEHAAVNADEAAPGLVETPLGERVALHVGVPLLPLAELRAGVEACPVAVPRAVDARSLPILGAALERELALLAQRLGVDSSRALAHAWRAARVAAALDGAERVEAEHAALAAQLVLAPRAARAPDAASEEAADEATDEATDEASEGGDEDATDRGSEDEAPEAAPPEPSDGAGDADDARGGDLAEALDAAVAVALPPDLLNSLAAAPVRSRRRGAATGGAGGRARGALVATARGRPTRLRAPRTSAERHRLDVAATLRAAVPWQRLRPAAAHGGLALRASDFRVRERRSPPRTTTLFVVDASGSAAMARIAEAKGAVESLLAECYVRRDRVALASFRDAAAHLDLPPTRSLVRARRRLSALPAGGGTPLAAALDLAADTLAQLSREGDRTTCIVMSDGRANVARDGTGGRARAASEALDAARRLGDSGARLLWIDTGARPRPDGRAVADAMGARYLPLPQGRGMGGGTGRGLGGGTGRGLGRGTHGGIDAGLLQGTKERAA